MPDRPALEIEDEIEITPEMIAAGAAVLWARDDIDIGPTGSEIVAENVIRAALGILQKNRGSRAFCATGTLNS
jgi:hypothetical protein